MNCYILQNVWILKFFLINAWHKTKHGCDFRSDRGPALAHRLNKKESKQKIGKAY